MPGIDPVTGLPLDLITPQQGQAPPGFSPQQFEAPLPGTAPLPGSELPPGYIPNPALQQAAPGMPLAPPAQPPIDLFQPLPPAPENTQVPGGAPQVTTKPRTGGGHGGSPGMVAQFDRDIAAQQARQAAAATALAQTQQGGAEAQAGEIAKKAMLGESLAGELIEKQRQNQQHIAKLDQIDAANLAKARDTTIPGFWKDRPGALVGSTIGVALAGIGAGLLGSTKNQALEHIQHNVDQYMFQQKEKIDNLYKYAEMQGKLNQQTRMQYAQDLLNLKDQHSYLMQSAADKVTEIAVKSRGAADAKMTEFLASQLGEKAIKDKMDVRELRSKMMLQEAQAEAARGAAAESRARAQQGGYLTPAAQLQEIRLMESQYKPFHEEAIGKGNQAGPVAKLAAVERTKQSLKEAYESKDPNRMAAAVTEVVEKVGPLLAGGQTSINLARTVKDMQTLGSKAQSAIGQITGGTAVGKDYYERLYHMLDSAGHESAQIAGDIRQRAVNKHLGPGGSANTPTKKQAFIANLQGTFGTSTYNGQPLFQNDPNAPAAPAQAPAAAPAAPGQAQSSAIGGGVGSTVGGALLVRPATVTTPDGRVYKLNPLTGSYD